VIIDFFKRKAYLESLVLARDKKALNDILAFINSGVVILEEGCQKKEMF